MSKEYKKVWDLAISEISDKLKLNTIPLQIPPPENSLYYNIYKRSNQDNKCICNRKLKLIDPAIKKD